MVDNVPEWFRLRLERFKKSSESVKNMADGTLSDGSAYTFSDEGIGGIQRTKRYGMVRKPSLEY